MYGEECVSCIDVVCDLPAAGFCIQQSPVLHNLQLQPCLDVQKHLVLLTLALQIGMKLHQLNLHSTHLQAWGEKTELLTRTVHFKVLLVCIKRSVCEIYEIRILMLRNSHLCLVAGQLQGVVILSLAQGDFHGWFLWSRDNERKIC